MSQTLGMNTVNPGTNSANVTPFKISTSYTPLTKQDDLNEKSKEFISPSSIPSEDKKLSKDGMTEDISKGTGDLEKDNENSTTLQTSHNNQAEPTAQMAK